MAVCWKNIAFAPRPHPALAALTSGCKPPTQAPSLSSITTKLLPVAADSEEVTSEMVASRSHPPTLPRRLILLPACPSRPSHAYHLSPRHILLSLPLPIQNLPPSPSPTPLPAPPQSNTSPSPSSPAATHTPPFAHRYATSRTAVSINPLSKPRHRWIYANSLAATVPWWRYA